MSADLTWLLIKNNNSFLVKRSGVQFSSEAGNLLNKNSFKYSGIANKKTVDVAAAASGRGVVVSTKKSKGINKVTLTKGIRKSAKSVAGLTRAGYRADLRKAALARVAAVLASQKPVKAAPKKSGKGVRANKQ
ncbi:60S ribosomal protein L28 [Mortierella sp. GBA30]|nr:60S ribosomal protein L28 [Mortierella sp. GBA30]